MVYGRTLTSGMPLPAIHPPPLLPSPYCFPPLVQGVLPLPAGNHLCGRWDRRGRHMPTGHLPLNAGRGWNSLRRLPAGDVVQELGAQVNKTGYVLQMTSSYGRGDAVPTWYLVVCFLRLAPHLKSSTTEYLTSSIGFEKRCKLRPLKTPRPRCPI